MTVAFLGSSSRQPLTVWNPMQRLGIIYKRHIESPQ